MERCPTCRGRVGDSALCGRCQTDLTLVRAAEASAAARLRDSITLHLRGHGVAARQAVRESLRCKETPLARAWLAFLERPRMALTPPAVVASEPATGCGPGAVGVGRELAWPG